MCVCVRDYEVHGLLVQRPTVERHFRLAANHQKHGQMTPLTFTGKHPLTRSGVRQELVSHTPSD